MSDTERCSQTKGFLPAIVNIRTGLSHSERRICVVAESIVTGFLMIEDSNNYKIAGCPPSVKGDDSVCVCVLATEQEVGAVVRCPAPPDWK